MPPSLFFIMDQIIRPVLFQPFTTFVVAVGTTPTPIGPTLNRSDLINSFVISLDAGAANNVFMGDQGVTITTGIEIVAGAGPVRVTIEDERMKYELLRPLLNALESYQCLPPNLMDVAVPVTVWDLSQIFLVAAAATNVRIAPFRMQFV